ncbi:ABC transporter substrate-binding protein [Castellaniella sp. MT123]|uniref:ABC transporter substrate-binding protein n=1 Tax=Castellaniella sp. MT123 TaxID=3140381 RepID=UPI0031F3BA00|nr:ABC transporter substrate-binding protein [Castellaniella sp.]
MKHFIGKLLAACILAATGAGVAQAQDLKVGLVLPLSGPFASTGQQMMNGAQLYLKEHGDTVAGRRIVLIPKDDTGVSPAISKRQAQTLLIQDKVEVLAGFGLTPGAFSVAPLATEAKVPMVVLNAATSSITTKSPYIVRTSMTLPQVAAPMASWAVANGIRRVYVAVADYGPGHDAAAQFKKTFSAAGGDVVGEVHTPLTSPDFAPYLQKIKDVRPDAVFLFVPNGEQGVAFAKGYRERGLSEAGIRLLATGDVVTEDVLAAMGDSAVGMISAFHYSEAHESPENKSFVDAYAKAYPGTRPNMVAVAAYDGMRLIRETLLKTGGNAQGDAFIAAAEGLEWTSPRGPVRIDPKTRDIVQNVYIRKVERVNGVLQNVEFDTVAMVRDPGKE